MAKKLAIAVAAFVGKADPAKATVEDLLNYYPMRYEDRSNLARIDELTADVEASVEINTRVSGGYRVGKNRGPKQPPLYIFEISGGDARRQMKPVVVWWFVSGRQRHQIVQHYQKRFDADRDLSHTASGNGTAAEIPSLFGPTSPTN